MNGTVNIAPQLCNHTNSVGYNRS